VCCDSGSSNDHGGENDIVQIGGAGRRRSRENCVDDTSVLSVALQHSFQQANAHYSYASIISSRLTIQPSKTPTANRYR